MGKYGEFTFTPPHEMTDWGARPLIRVSNYGAYGSYNEQWRRIESDVRWSNREFISIAQLLYILHNVVLPFDDWRYTKGWKSIDDFEERENPYARGTCRAILYVKPPVEFTEDECKASIELGKSNQEHLDWIREWKRVSTWIVVYDCLKTDPVEWVKVEFRIENATKVYALDKAKRLVKGQGYEYEQFVKYYEAGGGKDET